MRYSITPICLLLSVAITGTAAAEDDAAKNQDRSDRRAEMRQKILDEFDADGDGQMSEEERATAREEMRRRRGNRANRGEGRSKGEGRPPRDGEGRRRGGPGGPPDPGQLFDQFDANDDGQLSRAEFMKLTEHVRANRPPRPRDDRNAARPRRPRRPDGAPEEARRRFDRERPLQSPDDRPGPPPPPEGRRRLLDEDGPRGRDRGDRGPRGRGGEGFRPPPPEMIFERFDENGDDQLSREEFMKLADRMRQMHERMRPGGDRDRMRDGRGPRRGPRGDDNRPRRPRRPRPDSETGSETQATDDNSV